MIVLFYVIAIISGVFGIMIVFAPKSYSAVSKRLAKTVATLEDASSKYRVVIGILLLAVCILTFYVIYLHKSMQLLS
jgi:hypothetical protein